MKLGDNMTMEAYNMWGDMCPRKCRPPRIGDIPKHGAVDEESPGTSTNKLTISPTDSTDSVESSRDVAFLLGTTNSSGTLQAVPKFEACNDLTVIACEQHPSEKSFHKILATCEQEYCSATQQANDALGKPFYVKSDILRKSSSPPKHFTERKQGVDVERTGVGANNRVTIKLSATSTDSLTRKLDARSPSVEQPEGTRVSSSPDETSDSEIREVRKDSALFLEEAEGLPTLREILKNHAPRIIRPRRESSGYASNLGTFDEDRRNSSTADVLQDLSSFFKERRRSPTKRLSSRTTLGRAEDSLGEEVNVGQASVSERMPTTEINRKISSAGLEMPNIEEVKELQREEASSRQESLDDLCSFVDNVNISQSSNHMPTPGNNIRPSSKNLTKSMTPVMAEFLVSEGTFSVSSLQKTVVYRPLTQDARDSSASSEHLSRQCNAVSAKLAVTEKKSARTFDEATEDRTTRILTRDVTGSSASSKYLSRQCSAACPKTVMEAENSVKTSEVQAQGQRTKTSTQNVPRSTTSDRHLPGQCSAVSAKLILERENSAETSKGQYQGQRKKYETDRQATTQQICDQQHESSSKIQNSCIRSVTKIIEDNLTPGYRESGAMSNVYAKKATGASQVNEQTPMERHRRREEAVKLDKDDQLTNSRKCSAQPLIVSEVSPSQEDENGVITLQISARDHWEKCCRHDKRAKSSKFDRATSSSTQNPSPNSTRVSISASSNLQNVHEGSFALENTDKLREASDRFKTNQETGDLRSPSAVECSAKLLERQEQLVRNDDNTTLVPQNEPIAAYSRSVKIYQLLSTQSEDRADGELHLADRRISLQIPRQDDDDLPMVSISGKSVLSISSSQLNQSERDGTGSRKRDSKSGESLLNLPTRKLSSPGEVEVHRRYLGDATSVSIRPIYPYCPYSPYGSPQGSPRNRRRPLRESRRVSIDNKQGELQLNQYKLLDNIGQGSYGIVKLVYNEEDETHYAMKILSKKKLMKKAGIFGRMAPGRKGAVNPLAKVYREIALLKKLDHPNVVKLVEVLDDPDEDNLYLAFELVEKGEVLQIPTDKPLDEDTARKNFRDVVMGVEYLHYQRIVHRDIKPSNLLVDSEGRIKIADLGVSAELRASGELLSGPAGTPAFAAPETTTPGAHYSGTLCDVWSMGVTLFSLVTGRVPWDGAGSIIGVQAAVRSEPLKFPEKPKLSDDLRNIISRMLAKEPSERIALRNLKEHSWLTNNGKEPLPSEADNCRLPVTVTDEEVERVVTRVPKLDTLILIKTMLKQHSFQNPFLPKRAGRTNCNDADTSAIELSSSGRMVDASANEDTIKNAKTDRFHRVGRSNSAPDSYNWQTNGRQVSVESPLPPVTEASSQESEIEKR